VPIYQAVKSKKEDGCEEDFVEGFAIYFLFKLSGLRVFDKDGNGQISVAGLF
jgi:hypothetical protein